MILSWSPSRQITLYYSSVALQQRLQNQDNLRVPGIISTIFATPYFTSNGHVIRRDVNKVRTIHSALHDRILQKCLRQKKEMDDRSYRLSCSINTKNRNLFDLHQPLEKKYLHCHLSGGFWTVQYYVSQQNIVLHRWMIMQFCIVR